MNAGKLIFTIMHNLLVKIKFDVRKDVEYVIQNGRERGKGYKVRRKGLEDGER